MSTTPTPFFDDKFVSTTLQGVVAQAFVDLFLGPVNRLMILQQSEPKYFKPHPLDPPVSRGSAYYAMRIVKKEGFWNLWKGNLVGALKNAVHRVATCIFAKLYEPIFLKEGDEKYTGLKEFLLLAAVEFSALAIQHPFKVVQIRMATDLPEIAPAQKPTGFRAIARWVKRIWQEEGLRGFYKGITVAAMQSLLRVSLITIERNIIANYTEEFKNRPKYKRRLVKDLIYSGSPSGLFLTYLKNSTLAQRAAKKTQKAIFNALYKLGTALILYPFHVVQTRMIANEERVREIRPNEMVTKILEDEGFRGFYRGLLITTVHTGGSFILLPIFRAFTKGFVGKSKAEINEKRTFKEKGAKYLKKKKGKEILLGFEEINL